MYRNLENIKPLDTYNRRFTYETTTRRFSFSEEISPEKGELLILMRRGGHCTYRYVTKRIKELCEMVDDQYHMVPPQYTTRTYPGMWISGQVEPQWRIF
ncbi:MAG: hypothetical protein QXF12_01490 [Candidatus Aenigmatarchaeota archaeon]